MALPRSIANGQSPIELNLQKGYQSCQTRKPCLLRQDDFALDCGRLHGNKFHLDRKTVLRGLHMDLFPRCFHIAVESIDPCCISFRVSSLHGFQICVQYLHNFLSETPQQIHNTCKVAQMSANFSLLGDRNLSKGVPKCFYQLDILRDWL